MSSGMVSPLSVDVERQAPQRPADSGRRAFGMGVLSGGLACACIVAVTASSAGAASHGGKFASGLVRPPTQREGAPAISMQQPSFPNPFRRPEPVPAAAPVPAPVADGDQFTRRDLLQNLGVAGAAAVVAPAAYLGAFGEPPPFGKEWQRLPDRSASPFVGGAFSDPKHKGGTRQLTLVEPEVRNAKGFRKAEFQAKGGKDEPPSFKLPAYVGTGDSREKIVIDFSAKGGPKDVEGIYECNNSGVCGIKFPDGNFWPKNLNEYGQKQLWAKKKAPAPAPAAAQ